MMLNLILIEFHYLILLKPPFVHKIKLTWRSCSQKTLDIFLGTITGPRSTIWDLRFKNKLCCMHILSKSFSKAELTRSEKFYSHQLSLLQITDAAKYDSVRICCYQGKIRMGLSSSTQCLSPVFKSSKGCFPVRPAMMRKLIRQGSTWPFSSLFILSEVYIDQSGDCSSAPWI